ncbi:MAG TPA: hypothetical protein VMU83_03930 [Hanamia sp.]|nr:hypothetical protein [Hanamia sp.]
MKATIKTCKLLSITAMVFMTSSAIAQKMQYFRPNDKNGLNVFETTKKDSVTFKRLAVKVGGNFTQDFQALRAHNNATPVTAPDGSNSNELMPLKNGFNLAMANFNIDAQLSDGIRLSLTTYLSTRHHEDAWVKGGYIQFDKLTFLKSPLINLLMSRISIKVGDFDVDYGDEHFRRTDGGNTIYNPFVENYIMDAFATEIGGEIYYHSNNGFLAVGGISDGQLDPTVVASTGIDPKTGKLNVYAPAFHGKIGYDKQVSSDLRLRLTGSFYTNKSSSLNTLYWGDRTGSHYFFVMENTEATSDGNAWSGRYNPAFSEQVKAFMINPFLKYKGLEFFGTYEMTKGRTLAETNLLQANQYAADLIYRFPAEKKNFWIGARYNSVTAAMPGDPNDITINRITGSLGWFMTKNVMMKAEYVNQDYNNFPTNDIRSGGQFNGVMIEASVGF